MKKLNIYLAPFAYYVRLNEEKFEENQKKGSLQKWFESRKGMLPYEFIEFVSVDRTYDSEFPGKIVKIGLAGSNVLCYHPFDNNISGSTKVFVPKRVICDSENEFHLFFDEGQSGLLYLGNKYFTEIGRPYIKKISFFIDTSICNLCEVVEYSDGFKKSSDYHLISKSPELEKPEWYYLFNIN